MFGCEESVYIGVSHSLSLPFECWSCVSMATLTPGSQCYFFSTQVASLQSLSLSPSLSSILPSHSSSPVLSPTRIASLSSFAIVYQSNKEKNTLYSLSAPAQSILFSGCVSSFSFQDIFTLLTHIHAQTQRIRNSPSSSLYSDIVQSQFISSLDLFVSRPL